MRPPTVRPCDVPPGSYLRVFKDSTGYADCYVIDVPGVVAQEDFVVAFYTSPLFKAERTILKYLASKPATDADVKHLAAGQSDKFAAWIVERRSPSELLLADFTGRTRSWLMTTPGTADDAGRCTQLYFGSAVIPRSNRSGKSSGMGFGFYALLGFHRLYSSLLLSAASRNLCRKD